MAIEVIRNIEPARQFLFDLFLTAPVAMPTVPFRVKTTAVPEEAVESLEINYKYEKASFAGRDAAGHTWTCTFWDDVTMSIRRAFYNWKKLMNDPVTGIGAPKAVYQGVGTLVQMSPVNSPIAIYELKGVYPENIAEMPLSYDASEAVEISVTFRYDYFTMSPA